VLAATALLSAALAAVALLAGCVSGPKPLALDDMDKTGWDKPASFQCYLSSQLTLTKLAADSPANVGRDMEAAALARETIVLPTTLRGRMLRANKRDQYVYVAFEAGDAALPFAKDKNDQFTLMVTISGTDQRGIEFVEYEGARYRISLKPYLNADIVEAPAVPAASRSQSQAGGSQARAPLKPEEAVSLISEKFIAELPERSVIAVLDISPGDKDAVAFIRDELEYRLTDSKKFTIVDRKSLDAVRSELEFQASGEVSDESASSIGRMLGENIVFTGGISGAGNSRRLNIKALDVESAVIMSQAREPF
jgi:hypothetical protein